MTKVTKLPDGIRAEVTFPGYTAKDGARVPAYVNVVRLVDLAVYVARVEAERAGKPSNWTPS